MDILLANTIQVLFWPNIFLVWIKKELVQVHEFQADAGTAADLASYSRLLVSSVFNTCTLPMTHSFIIHPIKRRIMMLSKNKNKTKFYFGALAGMAALFLLFNIVSLQSCKRKTFEVDSKPGKQSTVTSTEEVYKYVDKMPEFNGNLMQFMGANVKYPEHARANNIEGRVNVQFVVSSTGEIKDVTVVGKKPVDSSLKRAAVEAVSKMPNWVPGEKDGKKVAVVFTMPVSFKL
jgi:TonB family protein